MLLDLPPEILLAVLKYLSVSDILSCTCTSKTFKGLIDEHESAVYRQAAAHPSLQLIPHDQILFSEFLSLGLLSKRYIGQSNGWKELCRRACQMRSCWLGKGASRIRNYRNAYLQYPDVHRIKVDERRGFFITTHGQNDMAGHGRLVVSEIDDGQAIWGLDSRHIRQHAHCEYGEGFLIFDRSLDAKEVWRLVSVNPELPDPEESEVVPESVPDEFQMNSTPCFTGGRLKFVPHALLRPPGNISTRAFRFVYPTLLVAAFNCLFLWDVRTGKLVERMEDIQSRMPPSHTTSQTRSGNLNSRALGRICYVEVNEKYAFVCGELAFKVFQRRGSQTDANKSENSNSIRRAANCVLAVTRPQLRVRGKWRMRLGYVEQDDLPEGFGAWNTNNHVYDTDESEWDDAPTADGWQDDVDDVVLEEDNAEARSIEPPPGSHRQNLIDTGGSDHRYPRISMWKKSGKAIVRHKTEPIAASYASAVLDEPSEFCIAVHVSPCGRHLAILANMSRLLIIPYFERVLDGTGKDYHDTIIDLRLGSPQQSIYLAYENDRIGVVTQAGVFIVHPSFPPPDDYKTPPTLQVHRVPLLNDPQLLFYVSCLQMTSTALWMNWEVGPNRLGLFSPDSQAMLEEAERSFEASLDTVAFFHSVRWPDNSHVLSVEFGLEN